MFAVLSDEVEDGIRLLKQAVPQPAHELAAALSWHRAIPASSRPRRLIEGVLSGRKKVKLKAKKDEASYATLEGTLLTLNRAGGAPPTRLDVRAVARLGAPTGFSVTTARHTYLEAARTEGEREAWVGAIEAALLAEAELRARIGAADESAALSSAVLLSLDRSVGDDIGCKELAAAAFVTLATRGEVGQAVLMSACDQVCAALVQLLSTHQSSLVQELAAFVLRSMTGWGHGLQATLLRAGCLQPLLAIATRAWAVVTERLVEQATATIGNLAAHRTVAAALLEGGTAAALSALLKNRRPQPTLASRKYAAFGLANLASSAAAQRTLASVGAADALVIALDVPPETALGLAETSAAGGGGGGGGGEQQLRQLRALGSDLLGGPDHARRLALAEAREQACRALRNLAATDPSARLAVARAGTGAGSPAECSPGLPALVALVRVAELAALDEAASAGGAGAPTAACRARLLEVSYQAAAALANVTMCDARTAAAADSPAAIAAGGCNGVSALLATLRWATAESKRQRSSSGSSSGGAGAGPAGGSRQRAPTRGSAGGSTAVGYGRQDSARGTGLVGGGSSVPAVLEIDRLRSMVTMCLSNLLSGSGGPAAGANAALLQEAGGLADVCALATEQDDAPLRAQAFALLHRAATCRPELTHAELVARGSARLCVELLCATAAARAAGGGKDKVKEESTVACRVCAASTLGALMTTKPGGAPLGVAWDVAETLCRSGGGAKTLLAHTLAGGDAGATGGAIGVNALLHMLRSPNESLEAKVRASAALSALVHLPPREQPRRPASAAAAGAGAGAAPPPQLATPWAATVAQSKHAVPSLLACVQALLHAMAAKQKTAHSLSSPNMAQARAQEQKLASLEQLAMASARVIMAIARRAESRDAMCCHDAENKPAAESVVVDALLAMSMYRAGTCPARTSEVRVAAAGALANLALGQPPVKQRIGRTSYLKVFIGALGGGPSSSSAAAAAAAAATLGSPSSRARRSAAEDAADSLREKSAAVLGNLATNDDHYSAKIGGLGALRALLDSCGVPAAAAAAAAGSAAGLAVGSIVLRSAAGAQARLRAVVALKVLSRLAENRAKLVKMDGVRALLCLGVAASLASNARGGSDGAAFAELANQSLALVCNLLVQDSAAQEAFGTLELLMPAGGVVPASASTSGPLVLLMMLAADGGTSGPSGAPNDPRWQLPARLRTNAVAALRNALAVDQTCEDFCTASGTGLRFPIAVSGVQLSGGGGGGGVGAGGASGSAKQYAAQMGRRRASLNGGATAGRVLATSAARPALALSSSDATQFQRGSGPQWLLHTTRALLGECGCERGRFADAATFKQSADLLEPLLAAVLNLSLVSAACRAALLEAGAAGVIGEVLRAMVPAGASSAAAAADEACAVLAVLAAGTLEHLSRQSSAAQLSLAPAAPELVAMLADSGGRGSWARRAGFALWSLVVENGACQEAVLRAGALPPLVSSLKAQDVEVRAAAAGALWNLAALEEARAGMVQLGAVASLHAIVEAGGGGGAAGAAAAATAVGHRPRARSGATNDAYRSGDDAARRRAMKYAKVSRLCAADFSLFPSPSPPGPSLRI